MGSFGVVVVPPSLNSKLGKMTTKFGIVSYPCKPLVLFYQEKTYKQWIVEAINEHSNEGV